MLLASETCLKTLHRSWQTTSQPFPAEPIALGRLGGGWAVQVLPACVWLEMRPSFCLTEPSVSRDFSLFLLYLTLRLDCLFKLQLKSLLPHTQSKAISYANNTIWINTVSQSWKNTGLLTWLALVQRDWWCFWDFTGSKQKLIGLNGKGNLSNTFHNWVKLNSSFILKSNY